MESTLAPSDRLVRTASGLGVDAMRPIAPNALCA